MTQENQGTGSAVPDNLPVKRKRGRPRKDRSRTQGQVSATPTPDTEKKNQRRRIDSVTDSKNEMVGQAVFGVLDGSFDAGYLLTVRVGDTDTILKGVVFQPGSSIPISGSNDVAPHIKMLKRAEIHIPQFDLPTRVQGSNGQSVQMNKIPDKPPQRSEGCIQEKASPPVNQAPIVPPQISSSQPQVTRAVQNDAEEHSGGTHQPASATGPSTLKHLETVKHAMLPETEASSISEAPGHQVNPKTESLKHDQLPHSEDQTIMPDNPVDAALECQNVAAAPHMMSGPTAEPVKILQENKTDQLGEILSHEAILDAPFNSEAVHAAKLVDHQKDVPEMHVST